MRILILGSSGAGKTYLAKRIAHENDLPHLELDSLRHQANWQALPDHKFRKQVGDFCQAESWVVDGNYQVVRDLLLARATQLILLDYPKRIVMRRLLFRSLARVLSRKTLWNGNRESIRYLFSPDPEVNVVLWSWANFDRRRREFDELEASFDNICRVRHPRQVRSVIRKLSE